MCFKNIPVEFDENGRARLKEGVADPWSLEGNGVKRYTKTVRRPVSGGAIATKGRVRDWLIDPITRV
ncbi:MAG: hypothetical protein ACRDJ4_16615, partial [Actinomycetota bacterium]